MKTQRVAVIGAGAAGLVTARELGRAGHAVTIFEQGADLGGVWVYAPDTEPDPLGRSGLRIHSSLYDSLRTNLPRDLMAFLDYPFDSTGGGRDDWPRFPGHACVREYLERFARDFDLLPLIRFATRVTALTVGARWRLEYAAAGASTTEQFDAVAVCNGHFSEPRIPDLPGVADFPARLLHSHNYRRPEPFAGERVALLGASASALDLSTEIARVASAVYCCGDAFAQLPSTARVQGNLRRTPGIAALGTDGAIRLTDGVVIEPVDTLIFCTGYRYDYPFLPREVLDVADNWVHPLYRDLLHLDHETLAFIGIPFRVVPFPLFEIQARWFARLLGGAFALPERAARRAETEARIATLRHSAIPQRHWHQRSLDCYDYLDALTTECGCSAIPDWHRRTTAALMQHATANPGVYRDRPLPHFAPTRVPSASIADR